MAGGLNRAVTVDRVSLEPLPLWLVTLAIRQARDALPLQAPMQRRAGQMQNRWLKSNEALLRRQQHVPPEECRSLPPLLA